MHILPGRESNVFGKKGFTLVEIMIVVAVIAIIVAVAIPSFVNSRQRARRNLCLKSLRTINDAKSMWAVSEGHTSLETPTWDGLVPTYIKKIPVCPAGGTYTMQIVDTNPTCSVDGHSLSD